jgi:hypothetical protein
MARVADRVERPATTWLPSIFGFLLSTVLLIRLMSAAARPRTSTSPSFRAFNSEMKQGSTRRLRIAITRLRRVPHRRDRLGGSLRVTFQALPKIAILALPKIAILALPKIAILAKLLADSIRRRLRS